MRTWSSVMLRICMLSIKNNPKYHIIIDFLLFFFQFCPNNFGDSARLPEAPQSPDPAGYFVVPTLQRIKRLASPQARQPLAELPRLACKSRPLFQPGLGRLP